MTAAAARVEVQRLFFVPGVFRSLIDSVNLDSTSCVGFVQTRTRGVGPDSGGSELCSQATERSPTRSRFSSIR